MGRFRLVPPILLALIPSLLAPWTRAAKNDLSLCSNSSVPVASIVSPSPSAGASSASKASADKSATGFSSLPADAQGPISAALGKDDAGYWIHSNAEGLGGENPRQVLSVDFTKQGAEVRSHNLHWALETRAYGYGNALHPLKAVAPQANANRVEYHRDDVTEWYENGPLGLEQGFTLAHRPEKAPEKGNGQPLTLSFALSGDLVVSLEPEGKALQLSRKDGKVALRYTGLHARDATGRELRSWLEVRGEQLLVRVQDAGAQYPVTVDPWIQQAELTASDGAANDMFGSVAISGSTAVVGAYQHTVGSNFAQGAAYVFVQSGATWSQQAELTASDSAAGDYFGSSVAVDGSTVVAGAPYHQVGSNSRQGAAYVFVQSGTTWSQQAELTASDGAADDYFGDSVAVNGSTVVAGAYVHTVGSNTGQGAAYVFVQSGTTWSQQAELTASDGAADDEFGSSVAISGGTVVVGAPYRTVGSNQDQGAGYVFAQSGTTWSQQAELTASDGAGADYFGWSVALDGSTAVVGAPFHTVGANSRQGAAYVFVESGGTWSQQAEMTESDGEADDEFGFSVAVDGGTALVGAIEWVYGGSGSRPGAAYIFLQSGTTWSQQVELIASDGAVGDLFGGWVSISGGTALVGAEGHTVGENQGQGAAYVFGSSGPLYTLSASPSGLSLVQGTQGMSTITITPFNGFSGGVSFSASGLPSGLTAAFSPNPASSTSTLTLTASETATTGSATPLVVGTSGNLTQTTPLTLTVTGVTTVSLSPASLSFAKVAVDTTSTAKTVTVENVGTATLDISSIAIALGTNFAISKKTCGATLAVNKTCKVRVTFTPTQTQYLTDTLSLTDNASGNPQTVALSGTGIVQARLTPSSYTFPRTNVGDTSTHKFTLKNNLRTTLTGISYSTAAPFAVSTSTCGTTLNSGKSCTISVTFTPSSEETFTGTLTVTDSGSNSPQAANLSGTGD